MSQPIRSAPNLPTILSQSSSLNLLVHYDWRNEKQQDHGDDAHPNYPIHSNTVPASNNKDNHNSIAEPLDDSSSNTSNSPSARGSTRIVSTDDFEDQTGSDTINQFQKLYKALDIHGASDDDSLDPDSADHKAFKIAKRLDDYSKGIALNHIVRIKRWKLAKRMLENGFSPTILINTLKDSNNAVEIMDAINYYGLYKDKEGIKYMKPLDKSISLDNLQRRRFRVLRSISSDIEAAKSLISGNLIKMTALLFDASSYNIDEYLHTLSGLDDVKKSILLAFMVFYKKWEVAKKMIAMDFPQKIYINLLDHYPDRASVEAYAKLEAYDQLGRVF